jgi:hypothetical protein
MSAELWISLGALALAVAIALGRVWLLLNRKIEALEQRQTNHQVAVLREFASISHFEKLETKLDRLLDKIEKLGLALAAQPKSRSRAQ